MTVQPDSALQALALAAMSHLPYDPNEQQLMVLAAICRFIEMPWENQDRLFLLAGYAGTGKTSLVGGIVKALASQGRNVVLMAPTGRAAKVFSHSAGRRAFTIHRYIYRGGTVTNPGMVLAENRQVNTLFIVDEASMIGDSAEGLSSSSLLADLIHYVYSSQGCRLLLMGDDAQLPPVGLDLSPAMKPEVLRGFGLKVSRAQLTMTARQQLRSGILWNATRLRRLMQQPQLPAPQLRVHGFADVRTVEGTELADCIAADYAADGVDNTIVITRINARATRFNLAIRSLINLSEEELVRADRLMVAKNNYFVCRGIQGIDFIANGDMAVVNSIHSTEMRHGLRFADVTLTMPDSDLTLDAKIILDSLVTDHPSLDQPTEERLRASVVAEATGGKPVSASEAAKILRADPYYNALRVKYAYAVTCHKAQGGQWTNVYIDLGYMPPEQQELEFYRWLYTAVTRSTTRLNLVNPPDEFLF